MDIITQNFQPDFLGIGTVKSGTSLVSDLLMQHPQIQWASRKEVRYFNRYQADGSPNPYHAQPYTFYTRFFKIPSPPDKIQGEFSPIYLYDRPAIDKITDQFPDIRLIVVLRNPVQRAFSHYLYARDFQQTINASLSFEEAVETHPFLIRMGFYGEQLSYLTDRFPTEQLKVLFFEEFVRAPASHTRNLYKFLNVDETFEPQVQKINAYKKVKYQWIRNLFDLGSKVKKRVLGTEDDSGRAGSFFYNSKLYPVILRWKHRLLDANTVTDQKPVLNPDTAEKLREIYQQDMVLLKDILGRELPDW